MTSPSSPPEAFLKLGTRVWVLGPPIECYDTGEAGIYWQTLGTTQAELELERELRDADLSRR